MTRISAAKARAVAKKEVCAAREDERRDAAKEAGLRYVSDDTPGITRRKRGNGWRYVGTDGKTITDHWEKKRIDKIAVPPAYTQVWICPNEKGHIQATGRDERGRKQYRYHAKWTEARDSAKFDRMADFARLLPKIRTQVAADMRKRGLPREKVLATLVALLEKTLIRIGNDEYARENKSFGLTTLRNPHVDIDGATMRFDFKGKSGKTWSLDLRDRRVAKVMRSIQDLPGQHLFQYLDDEGTRREVDSADVNAYLREVAGEGVSAKDFRTWAGSVFTATALREFAAVDGQNARKRHIKIAIERVAKRLGNTPTICRKCYVHPEILVSYLEGRLLEELRPDGETQKNEGIDQLKAEEVALLGLLSRRVGHDMR